VLSLVRLEPVKVKALVVVVPLTPLVVTVKTFSVAAALAELTLIPPTVEVVALAETLGPTAVAAFKSVTTKLALEPGPPILVSPADTPTADRQRKQQRISQKHLRKQQLHQEQVF
jgi:hypothetical protein